MSGHHLLRLLVICFFTLPLSLAGQSKKYPVNKWLKELSSEEFRYADSTFLTQIYNLPKAEACDALAQLFNRSKKANQRTEIKVILIYEQATRLDNSCKDATSGLELLNTALLKAYEIEDEILIAETYRQLGDHYYFLRKERGPALIYMLLANEEKQKTGEQYFRGMPNEWYELGGLQYHARDYEGAVKSLHTAINHAGNERIHFRDTLIDTYKMFAWNTLGLSYSKLNQDEKAFDSYEQALVYAHKTNSSFWKGLVQGNRGDIFFKQGMYDSAVVLLKYDYQQSKDTIFDNAANSLQWLARIAALQGDPHKALEMLKESNRLLALTPEYGHQLNMHYTYALAYKGTGNADSSFYHFEKYQLLHDSIERDAARNQTDIVRLRLDNTEHIQSLLALNKEKKRIQLIRNFTIALILLLATTGYFYLNRERLKLKLKQQEALVAKRRAESEAENAKLQLSMFTENLREKTNLLENLQSQLLEKRLNESQNENINELSQYSILTDLDWDRFKTLFNKVYPSFFIDLKRNVPDITLAEQRMAALIKLQIPGKDAANMLGISPGSVRKSRQRLRQRLGIEGGDELETFFSS